MQKVLVPGDKNMMQQGPSVLNLLHQTMKALFTIRTAFVILNCTFLLFLSLNFYISLVFSINARLDIVCFLEVGLSYIRIVGTKRFQDRVFLGSCLVFFILFLNGLSFFLDYTRQLMHVRAQANFSPSELRR